MNLVDPSQAFCNVIFVQCGRSSGMVFCGCDVGFLRLPFRTLYRAQSFVQSVCGKDLKAMILCSWWVIVTSNLNRDGSEREYARGESATSLASRDHATGPPFLLPLLRTTGTRRYSMFSTLRNEHTGLTLSKVTTPVPYGESQKMLARCRGLCGCIAVLWRSWAYAPRTDDGRESLDAPEAVEERYDESLF